MEDWSGYTLEDWRRFFAKIVPAEATSSPHVDTPCWLWGGAISDSGYGTFTHNSKTLRAHREVYKFCVGPIPRGHVLMHICDNPLCVNPHHHTTGTQAENIEDARQKGRLSRSFKEGDNNPNAKFTEEEVKKIKIAFAHGTSPSALAREYKSPLSTIKDICYGKTWTHVEVPKVARSDPHRKKKRSKRVQRKRTKERTGKPDRKFTPIRRKQEG